MNVENACKGTVSDCGASGVDSCVGCGGDFCVGCGEGWLDADLGDAGCDCDWGSTDVGEDSQT